jgi:hypothetical protein
MLCYVMLCVRMCVHVCRLVNTAVQIYQKRTKEEEDEDEDEENTRM